MDRILTASSHGRSVLENPRTSGSVAIGIVICALLSCGAGPASAACPESHASLCNNGTATLVAATFDSTVADPLGPFRTAYDLPKGEASMSQPGRLCGATVEAADAFDVVGVPAGTPVTLTVLFTSDGRVWTPGCSASGCYGDLTMRLSSGATVDEGFHTVHLYSGSEDVHDVRSIVVTISAGTPLEIRYYLHGQRAPGGSHGSEAAGRISFLGIPSGAAVVSCQGYNSSAVTPTRKLHWGSLKAMYR